MKSVLILIINQDANSIFKEDERIKECNLVKYCNISLKHCVVMRMVKGEEDGREKVRKKKEDKIFIKKVKVFTINVSDAL